MTIKYEYPYAVSVQDIDKGGLFIEIASFKFEAEAIKYVNKLVEGKQYNVKLVDKNRE